MEKITVALTSLYLLAGIFYFGAKTSSYSHVRHTISELGEQGAKNSRKVSYGLFLPVGFILVLVALLIGSKAIGGLSFCLGTGYLVAAFFPCDPGSPMSGSWRQHIHNAGGFIEYAGSAYFLSQADFPELTLAGLTNAGVVGILLICIIILSIPKNRIRGLAQRVAEGLLFGVLFSVV